jgi:hypothetical protein
MTVFAGVRKLSDATIAVVVEFTTTSSTTAGSFALFAPISAAGAGDYQFRSGGSVPGTGKTSTGFAAPVTSVITGLADIAGDSINMRVNGVLGTPTTLDQGTGNYANAPLYIGRRNNTNLPFNGHLYSLIIRGAQSSDSQIASAESYVNSKTGAY